MIDLLLAYLHSGLIDCLNIFFQLLNDSDKPAETEKSLHKDEANKKSSVKSKVSIGGYSALYFISL